ncbi:hypothetical protein A2334_04200 [Candidatus Roizmanbacteria bacterium RIFOXYB2_FULL_38_10]|uniref:Glycosyltransferase RgtA/B/C/D-like domain-containing protein n=1 Tax=Candidatus Roizmanbacteria bacterium RIFOXYD1_FULL_38_12 TaxID=1802093 RepID=A0A1F7KZC9_9BACT|nr:MAG: hypothetical protein A3K47_00310 [Candidatus Roizmanbacteria bacterium RIFOXYA2_FULL_38_14]OGK63244.1 MAG: hypothetical protein A3K27_00310 [Candidatus Roizmanbacteria bacterium RIFOXYA1_FULL_37_12]OGK65090.1 MAG: hypothetical protein A3K38_00310 [Candidatus Roizmanbacteria bacterium RIFOXYB1_FULL_40_23]OGK68644.1 MAG: hypothetical protein A2334_04200 [Candidatus Roizmanbacteria bacterium RIFOXYB2_FULL_38_10]OGK69494.1 MAG: hypothetical protein A3K21_00310 [Candidatus Roizmanbacteria ba
MKRLNNIAKWIQKNKLAVFIILCAIFLRLWRVGEFAMFLADQGRDAIIIKRIVTLQHLPLIGPPSSIGQVYLGPFFYYLMAPFLLLFAFNPAGLAYGVSFISIVGLVLGYFIIRKILDKKIALIFLILTSFSSQLLWLARFSWNPNLLPIFSFFTLYFFYKSLKTEKYYYSIAYGAFFALSFQLHHLAAFLAVPIGIVTAIFLFRENKKTKQLLSVLIAFIAFLCVTSPLILFDLKHDFLNTKNLVSLFTKQDMIAGGSPAERLIQTNHAFWMVILQIKLPAFASIVASILFVGGFLFLFIKGKVHLLALIHMINLVSFIYFFSLLSNPRHPHYYGSIYLSFFVVCALLLGFIPKKIYSTIALSILLAVYLVFNMKDYYFITGPANNQILHAQRVSSTLLPYIDRKPFNFATYPIEFTSEEAYLYFLEKQGLKAANREAREVTQQMYVLCNQEPCNVLDSHSWNIDMFGEAKIDTMWEIEGIKVYRLIHK